MVSFNFNYGVFFSKILENYNNTNISYNKIQKFARFKLIIHNLFIFIV